MNAARFVRGRAKNRLRCVCGMGCWSETAPASVSLILPLLSCRCLLSPRCPVIVLLPSRSLVVAAAALCFVAQEGLRHKQLLNEHMASLSKLQGEIEEKDRAIKSLRSTNAALLEKSSFGDSVLRDKQDLQRENQTLRDKCRELTEKLVVFSVDSGVEVDELERALDIVRRQKDDPSRVAFLQSGAPESDPALDTVPSLRRRLSELELKCRDFILEIQTKSDLLNIQTRLQSESKRQIAADKSKIASLQIEVERLKYELVHRPAVADNLSESIFAMSDDGSDSEGLRAADQLTGLENLIAFRVLSANLNPHASVFLMENGEMPSTPPLTFLTADFYDFESSYSEVFGGYNPAYKFTTQFAVESDQFLVAHLESEDLVVGVYQKLAGENYRKIGVCYIALRGLLAPTAAIEGRAQILVAEESKGTGVRGALRDTGAGAGQGDEFEQRHASRLPSGSDGILGELHYVMRMKRPIVSTNPSPASSRGATPTQGRSRRGSLGHQSGAVAQQPHRASQLQSYQPSILSNTLSLHHANRDVSSASQQQPQGSRASMHQQSSAESSGRPSPALGSIQQQQAFSRQPSSRAAPIQTQAQSGQQQQQQEQKSFDERLTMDEFGEPQHSQRPGASRQQSQFQLQDPPSSQQQSQRPSNPRAPSTREVAGGGFSRAQSLAPQQQQTQAASSWEAEVDASTAAPAPPQRRPTLSHQSTHARTAEQEERDYQELINNPESQAGLFGDDEQF